MTEHTLSADYVIVGAGAVGLAFADTLLSDSAGAWQRPHRHRGPEQRPA